MKPPKETELREVNAPEVIKLLKSKGAPDGTRCLQYGRCEILLVPPDGTRGYWLSIYREDRPVTQAEIQAICRKAGVPAGIQMSGRIENERADDGNFHAQIYELVKLNGDPPYVTGVEDV